MLRVERSSQARFPWVFGGSPGGPPGPSRRPDSARAAPAAGPSRRILVAEDNLDQVHSLVMVLRNEGHEVEFAINGYVALDIARRFRPQVILLDLGLPGLNGLEVCRRLKREPGLETTRIIAVTGYASEEHRAQSRAAGCDVHVAKPYDLQHLLSLIRNG